MAPGEIEEEISKQELNFRTLCDLAIREIKSSDMSKQIGRERKAITQRRKKDKEEKRKGEGEEGKSRTEKKEMNRWQERRKGRKKVASAPNNIFMFRGREFIM